MKRIVNGLKETANVSVNEIMIDIRLLGDDTLVEVGLGDVDVDDSVKQKYLLNPLLHFFLISDTSWVCVAIVVYVVCNIHVAPSFLYDFLPFSLLTKTPSSLLCQYPFVSSRFVGSGYKPNVPP